MRPVSMQRKVRGFVPALEGNDLANFYYKNLTEEEQTIDFTDYYQQKVFVEELKSQGIRQVFMDNFFCLFPNIKNWNDPQEFLQFIFPFICLFREAKITAWWIDHNGKAGQIFGSTAKMIHFDFIMKIYHEDEEDLFDLELIKEREKLDKQMLCFSFVKGGGVQPETSKRLGEGSYKHFWEWAEDYMEEAKKKCDGNKAKMASWLIKSYIDCHESIDASELKADWIRRKI